MKRFLPIFILLVFFTILFSPPSLYAQEEKIQKFTTEIQIHPSAQVDVVETIVYDFGTKSRHGIFRNIPLVYENRQGEKFKIDLAVNKVTDDGGTEYQYTLNRSGEYMQLKIGNPEVTISGVHTYRINYTVAGVITYFSDHDELYWNVTGNQWNVPIETAQAMVTLPAGEFIKATCYTGARGERKQQCNEHLEKNRAAFSASRLSTGEGLTIVTAFPKGIVAVVEPKKLGERTFLETIILAFIGLAAFTYYLVAPFIVGWLWWRYGRDPKVGKPPTAWFSPPKENTGKELSPAEVGTLVDERADNRDITATIISLAIKGYLKIKETGKDNYLLIKIKDKDEQLEDFEKLLLDGLFNGKKQITVKSLKGKFYKKANKVKDKLYKNLVAKGFFPQNPQAIRKRYLIFSIVVFILGFNIPLSLTLLLFGSVMPRKSLAGARAQQIALALKNFLSSQEEQLKFQVKNWYMFEKLLPYAVVFGVEKIWAKRFADLTVPPPDWYEGRYEGRAINPVLFTQSFSRSLSNLDSVGIQPASSRSSTGFSSGFSSGGFSGGGFGGGGGGSW